ncbi:kinase-like domain-containing protein [Baffinella frigidus]|nr:kinase-like domain-containing protein [Cryptophyta sp. CCMP2293]
MLDASTNALQSDFDYALQSDFDYLDTDGSGRVSLEEIIQGAQMVTGRDVKALDLLLSKKSFDLLAATRIEMGSDHNQSGDIDLDFWEFCFLAFLMVQDGSYQKLVGNSKQAHQVKQALVEVNCAFLKYNIERNYRLTLPQMQEMLREEMGVLPSNAERFSDMMADNHFKDRPTVPLPRPAVDPRSQCVTLVKSQFCTVPKIDHVDLALLRTIKKLGEGGQGVAYSATYAGVNGEVAAKFLWTQGTPQVMRETEQEVALMRKMTHPNCHQLIGATTQPQICMLSEICPLGSIFDYYTTKLVPARKRFDEETARRLGRESAAGLEFMHAMRPPFMHRDVKSLNVFLSSAMTAKVADFGAATSTIPSSEPAGTIQWSAPEVPPH